MELFRQANIDWLGKKWYFLGFSLIFSVSGVLSMLFWHHIPLDVDFRGGTVVRVKFDQQPNIDRIRSAADKAGLKDARIQQYGLAANNEVIVTLAQSQTSEAALDQGRAAIVGTLTANYSATGAGQPGQAGSGQHRALVSGGVAGGEGSGASRSERRGSPALYPAGERYPGLP